MKKTEHLALPAKLCLPFALCSLLFAILLMSCPDDAGLESGSDTEDIKTITITLNPNGGNMTAARSVQIFEGYPLPSDYFGSNIPTRNNYKFKFWSDSADTKNEQIKATKTFTKDTTLKANWEALETFNITFLPDGGTLTGGTSTTVQEGSTLPLDYFTGSKIPSKTGYRFTGWNNGATPISFLTKITSEMTLTAQWVWRITVSFNLGQAEDPDGGSSVNVPGSPPSAVIIDDKTALGTSYPRTDPAYTSTNPKYDYRFKGWYYNDTKYERQSPAISVNPPTSTFTLTAKWDAVALPENADSPAIHPGSHFTEIVPGVGGADGGVLTAKKGVAFTALGLFANVEVGTLSAKWYRAATPPADTDEQLAGTGATSIIDQTASAATPNEISLPFEWEEAAAGTYYYWVVVTNTNNKAWGNKTAKATTQNLLKVTVTE
jgi:uncharacterized repeat protein (TIGR02543 family)